MSRATPAAVCHGLQVLAAAGVLKGKSAASSASLLPPLPSTLSPFLLCATTAIYVQPNMQDLEAAVDSLMED